MTQEAQSKCEWCGKEIFGTRVSEKQRFCRYACKYKCQKAQRRIEREKLRAMASLYYIQEMLSKGGDLRQQAIEANQFIQDITREL